MTALDPGPEPVDHHRGVLEGGRPGEKPAELLVVAGLRAGEPFPDRRGLPAGVPVVLLLQVEDGALAVGEGGGAPGGDRTHGRPIRSRVLCPLSYGGVVHDTAPAVTVRRASSCSTATYHWVVATDE